MHGQRLAPRIPGAILSASDSLRARSEQHVELLAAAGTPAASFRVPFVQLCMWKWKVEVREGGAEGGGKGKGDPTDLLKLTLETRAAHYITRTKNIESSERSSKSNRLRPRRQGFAQQKKTMGYEL